MLNLPPIRMPPITAGSDATRLLKLDVVVANHAMSGETIEDSLEACRFDKVFSTIKGGDYLLMKFAHNDMKNKSPNARDKYSTDLEEIIDKTRKLKATPVLITSMEREKGVKKSTLLGYPDNVRSIAKEKELTLIDLNSMSMVFYKALGKDITKAFVDGSHHTNYRS